ncbi:MAG: DUF692 domain-containing protein [Bacteriovoracaceae bacterium]
MNPLFGVGLRTEHFPYLQQRPQTNVDWFEVLTENHMNSKGRPWQILEIIRADYPVSFHGVSLNIGLEAQLNRTYLRSLKKMIDVFNPFLVSDHLCWTGMEGNNIHNLLPLPYCKSVVERIASKMDQVQSFLGRSLALENLSAYMESSKSEMTEWEFLTEVARKSGCKILLDINNIYVNSVNHQFDPLDYLEYIPKDLVAQFHLAGFSDKGNFLFDTHSRAVQPEVWKLYKYAVKKWPQVPTLIEWDEDVPDFEVLENQALEAKKIWSQSHG